MNSSFPHSEVGRVIPNALDRKPTRSSNHGALRITRPTFWALSGICSAFLLTVPAAYAVDDLTLQNTTIASGQTSNQQANVTISANTNYNVSSGGQANFTAGIRITLDPTVHVYSGGGFHAMIDFNGNGTSDAVEYATGVVPPYTTSFESSNGFSLGNLNGQGTFYSGAGTVSVVNSTAIDGSYSINLPARSPTNSLIKHFKPIPGQAITYLDFYIAPVFTGSLNFSSYLDIGSAQVGFLQADAGGRLQVLTSNSQGAAQWLTVGPGVALNSSQQATTWQRLTVRLNYTTRVWDLYLNNQMIASNLALNSTDTFMPFVTLYGSTVSDTFFDWVYVGSTNPLPADTGTPTTPTSVSSPSATSTSVNLYWAASTETVGISGYNIYRNGTLIGTTSGLKTYFTDQNLSASTAYTYTVQALNTAGVASGQSTGLSVTTAASSTPSLEIFSPLK